MSLAYSPESGTLMEKILGKGSVLRVGGGIVYDHYGSAMVASFASSGSPGLATTVAQPVNTNFTTAFRYTGSALPTLPASGRRRVPVYASGHSGRIHHLQRRGQRSEGAVFLRDQRQLRAAAAARHEPRGGVCGPAGPPRRSCNQDFAQPLTKFKDPKSGQTWAQAGTVLAQLYNSGVTPAQVKANPSLVPNQPFFANMFPGLKNHYITGSASANFFYDVYGNYSGSFSDGLNDMDRIRQTNGGCIAVYGATRSSRCRTPASTLT